MKRLKQCFFDQRTVQPLGREKHFRVKKILGHSVEEDGTFVFYTHKIGSDVSAAEWLPTSEFLGQAGQSLVEYCVKNGLEDKVKFLTH